MNTLRNYLRLLCLALLIACAPPAIAQEGEVADIDGPEMAGGGENASNPLAKVKNTDVRWQYLDVVDDLGRINDYFVDGSFMINPKTKLKYELHFWETNLTGSSESGLESALVKLIYFPKEGIRESGVKYRLAFGVDLIADGDNLDKGIGMGADQIGPFAGIALALPRGMVVIPLAQQFVSISGEDVNITATRVIALQPLPKQMWLKADVIIPYDWETDTLPAQAELQWGINVNQKLALYVDGIAGVGHDKLFDWGVGVGVRFKY